MPQVRAKFSGTNRSAAKILVCQLVLEAQGKVIDQKFECSVAETAFDGDIPLPRKQVIGAVSNGQEL